MKVGSNVPFNGRAGSPMNVRIGVRINVRINTVYRFETDGGPSSLVNLFEGRSQLLLFHFAFGSDQDTGCPACSAAADRLDGHLAHLAEHDVTLCAVSPAPLAKLNAYRRRMGWSFPWASSLGSDFNLDFRPTHGQPGPRVSAFELERDWTVVHTHTAHGPDIDSLLRESASLDRAPGSGDETSPRYRHGAYCDR